MFTDNTCIESTISFTKVLFEDMQSLSASESVTLQKLSASNTMYNLLNVLFGYGRSQNYLVTLFVYRCDFGQWTLGPGRATV